MVPPDRSPFAQLCWPSFAQVPGQINADSLELSITTIVNNETVTLYLSSEEQPFAFDYPGMIYTLTIFCIGYVIWTWLCGYMYITVHMCKYHCNYTIYMWQCWFCNMVIVAFPVILVRSVPMKICSRFESLSWWCGFSSSTIRVVFLNRYLLQLL